MTLPEVDIYHAGGNFPLNVTYSGIPAPEKYDWSSFPPSVETPSYSEWTEEIAGGYQSPRIAVGIDHSAQNQEVTDTFLAGAIVGVAGAALIGSLQEALHIWADKSDANKRENRLLSGKYRNPHECDIISTRPDPRYKSVRDRRNK